jgi:predicted P-loop ATPase
MFGGYIEIKTQEKNGIKYCLQHCFKKIKGSIIKKDKDQDSFMISEFHKSKNGFNCEMAVKNIYMDINEDNNINIEKAKKWFNDFLNSIEGDTHKQQGV